MNKAYDAKVAKMLKNPSIRILFQALRLIKHKASLISCIPNLFMLIFLLPLLLLAETIRVEEINSIINRFLEYHVEYKEVTPTLLKRAFRNYIQQFDVEKTYLLEREVIGYLNMKDDEANKILARVKRDDFSDFVALNGIIKKSINRAASSRILLMEGLLEEKQVEAVDLNKRFISFATSESELITRQKRIIIRFLSMQERSSSIDTLAKKMKVFQILERKLKRFERGYASRETKVDEETLFCMHILKSIAKSLDAHSTFFSEEEAAEMRTSLEKEFEGIGVVLSESVDGVVITELVKNGPADRCKKIDINDLIVEVDGKSVENMAFEEVLETMKKKSSSEIVLGLKRPNSSKESVFWRVRLTREPISMDSERLSCTYEPYGDGIIGKIVLPSFYENSKGISSENDLREAISHLREVGNLKGIVLDLRDNAGGFLTQAIKVSGLFISNGVVVVSKYKNGEVHYLRSVEGKAFYNGPLVVLVSKLSASAAEIVAQCLQDYGVGIIVGDERTFGKGSIQYQNVTDKSASLFFKVTVGRYYTVSGKTTQLKGVESDVLVPTSFAPYNIGERFLENALSFDQIRAAYEDKLDDLEGHVKRWFQIYYLPYVQKNVTFWKKMIPTLKENSAHRLATNPLYKEFLDAQKNLNPDEFSYFPKPSETDLQLIESVNIVKDMIMLELFFRQKVEKEFQKKALYSNK